MKRVLFGFKKARGTQLIKIALIGVAIAIFLRAYHVSQQSKSTSLPKESAPVHSQVSQGTSSSQISALDKEFATDASMGGIAEIEIGKQALQKATNSKVKQYAQQMIQQHIQMHENLMQLAKKKGITPPTTLDSKHEAIMAHLMEFSGANFDEPYMNEMGVNRHLEATALFQREAALGKDLDLKAFAIKNLPTVQNHFKMAKAITKKFYN